MKELTFFYVIVMFFFGLSCSQKERLVQEAELQSKNKMFTVNMSQDNMYLWNSDSTQQVQIRKLENEIVVYFSLETENGYTQYGLVVNKGHTKFTKSDRCEGHFDTTASQNTLQLAEQLNANIRRDTTAFKEEVTETAYLFRYLKSRWEGRRSWHDALGIHRGGYPDGCTDTELQFRLSGLTVNLDAGFMIAKDTLHGIELFIRQKEKCPIGYRYFSLSEEALLSKLQKVRLMAGNDSVWALKDGKWKSFRNENLKALIDHYVDSMFTRLDWEDNAGLAETAAMLFKYARQSTL